jgi:hypothetical protein
VQLPYVHVELVKGILVKDVDAATSSMRILATLVFLMTTITTRENRPASTTRSG